MTRKCSSCEFVGEVKSNFPRYIAPNGKVYYRLYCKKRHNNRKNSWRSKNKDHVRLKARLWSDSNKEKRRVASAKWRKNNKEYQKTYRKNLCRIKLNATTSARRKKLRQATPKWLSKQQKKNIRLVYELCGALNSIGNRLHVDHIVPIKGKNVCGLHVAWNLRILDATENIKKSNRHEL